MCAQVIAFMCGMARQVWEVHKRAWVMVLSNYDHSNIGLKKWLEYLSQVANDTEHIDFYTSTSWQCICSRSILIHSWGWTDERKPNVQIEPQPFAANIYALDKLTHTHTHTHRIVMIVITCWHNVDIFVWTHLYQEEGRQGCVFPQPINLLLMRCEGCGLHILGLIVFHVGTDQPLDSIWRVAPPKWIVHI